jgi:N-acyl-D-aspartate/D-glutamate deacylase
MGEMAGRADIVIRGGAVIDGTGADRIAADVAITGDRIAGIGDLSGLSADRDIDATGMIVAPGFIDAHTHDDRALVSWSDMPMKVTQGVTSVVAGIAASASRRPSFATGRRRPWIFWAIRNSIASAPSGPSSIT